MLLWDEVGTALCILSCFRADHGIVLVVAKLPGTVNGSPYTSSADEEWQLIYPVGTSQSRFEGCFHSFMETFY